MKKFIAVLISAFLSVGNFYFVSAEENTSSKISGNSSDTNTWSEETVSEKLEQAIINVKKKIIIPDSYSKFEYDVDTRENGTIEYYNFTWSTESSKADDDYKRQNSIRVSADIDGNIYYYNSFLRDNDNDYLPQDKKSKSECLKSAEDFLKKVLPDNYSEFKLEGSSQNNTSFVFRQYKDNIPIKFKNVIININGFNLNVDYYSFENVALTSTDFRSTEGVIEIETAEDKFNEKAEFKPEYIFYYDYKTKEKKSFLAYNSSRILGKCIDAFSGELFDKDTSSSSMYDLERSSLNSKVDTAAGDAGYNLLSEKEIEEIKKSNNIISKEEADSAIKNIVPDFSGSVLSNASLEKQFIDDDKFFWSLRYKDNGYARIDAETKELIHFNINQKHSIEIKDITIPEQNNSLTREDKINKAKEFIQKNNPSKFDSVEFYENNSTENNICFVRKVNGYYFPENKIIVQISDSGDIKYYSVDWYDSVNFAEPSNIISACEAFNKIKESTDFSLAYEIKKNKNYDKEEFNKEEPVKEIILSYSLNDTDNAAPYILAENGEEVKYDGSSYERKFKQPENYADVKGHWCENYVNVLLRNGFFVKREKFFPDEKITRREFLDYYGEYSFDDDIRKLFKNNDSFITRKEMSDIIIKKLKYINLAEKKDAFKNHFSDVSETDSGFGSMAICNILDIISADENGCFNPENEITNAEAAKIIYGLEIIK